MTTNQLTEYAESLPTLSVPIANDGDMTPLIAGTDNETDTSASVKFGFPAKMEEPLSSDGVPVSRGSFNQIINIVSKFVHYAMAGGAVPYSSEESSVIGGYPSGAVVQYGGHSYKSKDNNNTHAPPDTTYWDCVDALLLTGGTMSGTIQSPSEAMKGTTTDGSVGISGSSSFDNGANLKLYGTGSTTGAGKFELSAGGILSLAHKELVGTPAGSLTWGGENIVISVGGVDADSSGNVDLPNVANEASATVSDLGLLKVWIGPYSSLPENLDSNVFYFALNES